MAKSNKKKKNKKTTKGQGDSSKSEAKQLEEFKKLEAEFWRVAMYDSEERYKKGIKAILAAPNVWTPGRYDIIYAITSRHVGDNKGGHIMVTKEEIGFLKRRFVMNESEPIAIRVEIGFAVMYVRELSIRDRRHEVHANAYEERDYWRRKVMYLLDLIKRSPPEDNHRVLPSPSNVSRTVKEALQETKPFLLELLSGTNKEGLMATRASAKMWRGDTLDFWGGDKCDSCGKAAATAPGGLLKCQRCELFYYCSKACQKDHWRNGGHKQCCCEKGSIKVGEIMLLDHPDEEGPLPKGVDPYLVKVLGPSIEATSGEGDNAWRVALILTPALASDPWLLEQVPSELLVPIRQDKLPPVVENLVQKLEEKYWKILIVGR